MQVEKTLKTRVVINYVLVNCTGPTATAPLNRRLNLQAGVKISQIPCGSLKSKINRTPVSLIILIVCRLTLKIHYNLTLFI